MEIDSDRAVLENWEEIETLLGGAARIDALAREHGALKRARRVRDGSQLLQLALGYAGTGHSLRTTAAWSEPAMGVRLCDVSLLGRLREAGDFLAILVRDLLAQTAETIEPSTSWSGAPIRLVDGSLFNGPGPKGGRHRLHASFDPTRGVFTDIDLTGTHKGESLLRLEIEPGAIAVADRNFAKTHALRQLDANGSFYAIRAGLRSVRLMDPVSSQRLTSKDILAALADSQACELAVTMIEAQTSTKSPREPVQARLIILKASEAATRHEQARIKASRRVHKATPTQETQDLAGVVMILTNLPADAWSIAQIAALYKLRWQIELAFKTLKSLFQMRSVPAKDPRLARTWILANLIIALLASHMAASIGQAIPPSHDQSP